MPDICYYSDAAQYGGAEIYLETLIRGCLIAGYNCSIIINQDNARFQDKLVKHKIPFIAINMGRSYNPFLYVEIIKIFKTIKPTLLHVNLPGPWACPFIAPLANTAGIKHIVTTEHLPMFGPSIRHTPIKYFTKQFVSRTITVSCENRQYLEKIHKINPDRIEVVHNGIDIEQFNFKLYKDMRVHLRKEFHLSENDLVFGIVGRLTEQKGHQYALKAVAKLSSTYPDIKLVVIGDGELLPYFKQMSENLKIVPQVLFLGFQNNMERIYAAIDVLLMPSTFEALPLTLLEAMAMNVPAIASNINGIPEVITNKINGLLIPPENTTALVEAMEFLYRDRSLLTQLGSAARKTIEHKFSSKKMVKDTITVYKNITDTAF